MITVTLKTSKNGRWRDSKRMMEYAFSQYRKYSFADLYQAMPVYATIHNADPNDPGHGMLALTVVPGSELDGYSIMGLPQDFDRLCGEFSNSLRVKYGKNLVAPIYQGDIMGTLTMTLPSGEQMSSTVIASRDVQQLDDAITLGDIFPWVDTMNFNVLWIIGGLVGAGIALAVALRIRNTIRINRRRRAMLKRRRDAYDKYKRR